MNQKLSEWASIAEIVAAFGVILSLIFVGLQIKDGNQETRAATSQATADTEAFFSATVSNHAGTWHKVVSGEPLKSGEEMRRGILLFAFLMLESDNQYRQFQSGYLDRRSWEGRLTALRPMVRLPIYSIWRQSFGAMSRSADFLEVLDRLAEEAPAG